MSHPSSSTTGIEVVEVQTSNQKKQFIDLPWGIYKDDPNWVAPLKISVKAILDPKHPFYETAEAKLWLALKQGQPVGRIMGVINHAHNKFHDEKCAFFGMYEAQNDIAITQALMSTVENYAKQKGMHLLRGPISPSTNYECGLLVEGPLDPPQIMMTYNPSYYAEHLQQLHFHKAADLLAYQMPTNQKMPEVIQRISQRLEKSNNITYRQVSKKHWDRDVQQMLDIYNDAWEKNWGFVPMTPAEFRHTAKDLKSVVDERFILFAEVKGEPAGFVVTLPDYNQVFKQIPSGKLLPTGIFKLLQAKRYLTRVRVITLGIKKQYNHLGLGSLLYQRSQQAVLGVPQYKEAEMSWILEDNRDMNKPLEMMQAKPYKRYRILEKSL